MPPVANRLRALIVESVEEFKDADAATSDARLQDMGLDSTSGLNLLLAMEEEFDVKFPEDMLTNEVFQSLGSLETALTSQGAR